MIEFAIELAATILVSAHQSGEKFGQILFADQVISSTRISSGQKHLMSCLEEVIKQSSLPRKAEISDPRVAIERLQVRNKGKYVVFLISDFIDQDIPWC